MDPNELHIEEHLLLQYLLGNSSTDERAAIERWLNKSERNRKLLDQLEALWLETGKLNPPPLAVDQDNAWERLSARIEKSERTPPAIRKQPAIRRFLRYGISAAAFLLLVLGVYTIIRTLTNQERKIDIASTLSVVRDTLPDNTRVTLNVHTKLIYSDQLKTGLREVKLTGEAFFDVSKDPSRPFIIYAGDARIKVLGTKFNVMAYPDHNILVSVTEGRVLFFTIDHRNGDTLSVILEAGQYGLLKRGTLTPEFFKENQPDHLYWMNQSLNFHETPLSEVISTLSGHFPVTITLSDPLMAGCRLTASFNGDPIDHILQVTAESFGFELEKDDHHYFMKGKPCVP